jgi:hypothetical protein
VGNANRIFYDPAAEQLRGDALLVREADIEPVDKNVCINQRRHNYDLNLSNKSNRFNSVILCFHRNPNGFGLL